MINRNNIVSEFKNALSTIEPCIRKQCPWCKEYFYSDKTEDELNQQFEDDKANLIEMGYDAGNDIIEVCDDCYQNRYSDENIENRMK